MKTETKPYKLRSSINFKLKKSDMETPSGKSLTVPDDSFTVQELLERNTRGLPLTGREGVFIDDSDIEDDDLEKFNRQDITDRFETAQRAGEIVRKEHEHQASKKERAKALEKENYEKWKKESLQKKAEPPERQEDTKIQLQK